MMNDIYRAIHDYEMGLSPKDICKSYSISKATLYKYLYKNNIPLRLKINKNKTKHPLYQIWVSMNGRCYCKGNSEYFRYGAKNIKVCDRWLDFNMFVADMSPRPSKKHSLDRIDGTKDYAPENCRWATPKQQSRNRKTNILTIEKARAIRDLNKLPSYTHAKLSRMFGVAKHTIACVVMGKIWKEEADQALRGVGGEV